MSRRQFTIAGSRAAPIPHGSVTRATKSSPSAASSLGGKAERRAISTSGTEVEAQADRIVEQALGWSISPSGGGARPERPMSSDGLDSAWAAVHETLRSPGRALDGSLRHALEPRFGCDFRSVRVHADAAAAESARRLQADAYTVGRDIAFAPGRYSPRTPAGARLLAHELAHVVQHSRGALERGALLRQSAREGNPESGLALDPPVRAIESSQGVEFVSTWGPPGAGLRIIAEGPVLRRHFVHEIRGLDFRTFRPVVRIVKTPRVSVVVFGSATAERLPFDHEIYEVSDAGELPSPGAAIEPIGRRVAPGSVPFDSSEQALTTLMLGAVGASLILAGPTLGTLAAGAQVVVTDLMVASSARLGALAARNLAGRLLVGTMQSSGALEIGGSSILAGIESRSVEAAITALALGAAQHHVTSPRFHRAVGRVVQRIGNRLRLEILQQPSPVVPPLREHQHGAPLAPLPTVDPADASRQEPLYVRSGADSQPQGPIVVSPIRTAPVIAPFGPRPVRSLGLRHPTTERLGPNPRRRGSLPGPRPPADPAAALARGTSEAAVRAEYEAGVRLNAPEGIEIGLYRRRDPATGQWEYAVFQGAVGQVIMPAGWQGVAHFHPRGTHDLSARVPSSQDIVMSLRRSSAGRSRERITFLDRHGSLRETEFGIGPTRSARWDPARPLWVRDPRTGRIVRFPLESDGDVYPEYERWRASLARANPP